MNLTFIDLNHIKRYPHSQLMFRSRGLCEQQLFKSASPESTQNKSVLTIELQPENSVKKTADLKSSGFFNDQNNVSFGAAPESQNAPKMGKFATALADSKIVHKFLKLAGKNPAVFEALTALFVAGALRPATIMSLPATAEDKEKNKKAAAHSIASGVFGFVSTLIFFQPIKDAMDKLYQNPEKYGLHQGHPVFDRLLLNIKGKITNPKRLKIYHDFVKYAPKLMLAPVTAAATIALIPIMDKHVLSKISKPAVKKTEESSSMDIYKKVDFKSYTGGQN